MHGLLRAWNCCINEFMARYGGGNVTGESSRVTAAWLECFPVKRFERSNEPDTALYKNLPFPCLCCRTSRPWPTARLSIRAASFAMQFFGPYYR